MRIVLLISGYSAIVIDKEKRPYPIRRRGEPLVAGLLKRARLGCEPWIANLLNAQASVARSPGEAFGQMKGRVENDSEMVPQPIEKARFGLGMTGAPVPLAKR
jgi:hypothetical protein